MNVRLLGPQTSRVTTHASAMAASFSEAAQTWDRLLASQVSMFADAEFALLESLPSWKEARVVADIGCGNGDYVARLAKRYPDKVFVGIEQSEDLLSCARERHGSTGVQFLGGAMETVDVGPLPFDFAILRFVVQHLTNPSAFFASVRRACKDSATVLVIEPCVEKSIAFPPLAEFGALVQRYEDACRISGSARSAVSDARGFAQLLKGQWDLTATQTIVSVHRRNSWKGSDLACLFDGWITTLGKAIGDTNCAIARAEIQTWLIKTGISVSISLHAWSLHPVTDGSSGRD